MYKALDSARHKAVTAADRIVLVEDSIESLRASINRVDSRTRMRDARAQKAEKATDGECPDWKSDPDGFIRHHEERLRNERFRRSQ